MWKNSNKRRWLKFSSSLSTHTHTQSVQTEQGLSKLVSLRKPMSRDAGRRAMKASGEVAGSPTEAMAVSAPLQFLAWDRAGPAASSALLSSKCLLTWAQRCLSFGMGPRDESSGASAGNAVLRGHRAKQSCWQVPHPCSKTSQQRGAPPRACGVWGSKAGKWNPKVRKPKVG